MIGERTPKFIYNYILKIKQGQNAHPFLTKKCTMSTSKVNQVPIQTPSRSAYTSDVVLVHLGTVRVFPRS